LTPAGGGMQGVNVQRTGVDACLMSHDVESTVEKALPVVAPERTFDHANGLATTLQRDRLQFYMFEDHSAATFRVRKALVPEEILFANTPDVNKASHAFV